MAKWGEGDPRWLVEHRDDGKNVNGWHWEERNIVDRCKQRLGELLSDLQGDVAPEKGSIVFTTLKEVTGEAAITIRKGNKKFPVFDLKLTLVWEGTVAGSDKKVDGDVKVEEFASASDEDDYIFTVSATGTGSEQDTAKSLVEGLKPQLVKQLRTFVEEVNQL